MGLLLSVYKSLNLFALLLGKLLRLMLLLRQLLRSDDNVRVLHNEVVVGSQVELESLVGLKLLRSKG